MQQLGTSKMSLPAQRALNRLNESHALNQLLIQDLQRHDAQLPVGTNQRFNASLEYYLGSQQLIHAADTLNSYSQSILSLIIRHSDTAWETVHRRFSAKQSRDEIIAKLESNRAFGDQPRVAIRDDLGLLWPGESEVILCLRNKFVHQNGHDPKREVEQEIRKNEGKGCFIAPVELIGETTPVRYLDGDWLEAGARLGYWACRYVDNHIHLLDQSVCHLHQVPRERWRPRPVSRTFSASCAHSTTGSETCPPIIQSPHPARAAPASSPSMPTSENDIQCAPQWHKWQQTFETVVEPYLADIGLELKAHGTRIVGLILPNTLSGQERSLTWTVCPPESDRSETICLRLREKSLVPFTTIWSTNSTLRDFQIGEEAKAIDYLKDCFDRCLTRNG